MTTVFKNQLQSGIGPTIAVTAVAASTPSSGSVRLTFTTQDAIPFPIGTYITVAGISVSGYNGTFLVTGASTSTVVFANATTGAATGGTVTPTIWISNAAAKTTVIGFSLTNTTPNTVITSVQLQDTVAGTTAYYTKDVIIPATQSVRIVTGGEKLILGPSTNVLVTSNSPSSVDAIMSFVEIS